MTTTGQIIDNATRRLDELQLDTPIHWTREELLYWLNEAVIEFNLIALIHQDSMIVTLNTTDNIYATPDTMIAPSEIYIDGKYLQHEQLDDEDHFEQWDSPSAVARVPTVWCAFGLEGFLLNKKCTVAGKTAFVVGPICPADLVDSYDVVTGAIPLNEEWLGGIEDFVVARALVKEGGPEFQQALKDHGGFISVALEAAQDYRAGRMHSLEISEEQQTALTTLGEK